MCCKRFLLKQKAENLRTPKTSHLKWDSTSLRENIWGYMKQYCQMTELLVIKHGFLSACFFQFEVTWVCIYVLKYSSLTQLSWGFTGPDTQIYLLTLCLNKWRWKNVMLFYLSVTKIASDYWLDNVLQGWYEHCIEVHICVSVFSCIVLMQQRYNGTSVV